MATRGDLSAAFGAVIRDRRRSLQLSQEGLASRANLHRTYVSQLERGLKSPTLAAIESLARALQTLPRELVGAAEDHTNS